MAKLKICAMSDLHGHLPEVTTEVDVVVICGDLVPLEYQTSKLLSEDWFKEEFSDWCKDLPCEKVIFIAGNHDFYLQFASSAIDFRKHIDLWTNGKAIYIEDELIEYQGVKFYGCPWCRGPRGWAFCPRDTDPCVYERMYDKIPDCDVLITHQPPKIENLGVSYFWSSHPQDWSSEYLIKTIQKKNILVNFCGHIHSGDHNRIESNSTVFYNVSYLDEQYLPNYKPRYVEIDAEEKTVKEIKID